MQGAFWVQDWGLQTVEGYEEEDQQSGAWSKVAALGVLSRKPVEGQAGKN